MDRRGLFKRLGVAAVAVAVGAPTLPAASETDAIRTLVEDVLAHPGKHPEIMADARRLMGERIGAGESSRRVSAVAVGASAAPQVEAEAEPKLTVNTHTYVAWTAAPELTFDDLVADCKARGCHLESTYSVERLRYEIAHWLDGETWVDDTMTTRTRDLEPVAAWLDGLHERVDRIHSEELGAAMDEITTKPGGEMLTADDYLRVRAMFRDMMDPA